jgi:thiol-disulfide isomerase/thioredoxin
MQRQGIAKAMTQGKSRGGLLAGAFVVGLVLAAGAVLTATAESEPPLQGRFADAFNVFEEPVDAPQVAFTRRDGTEVTLSQFEGRVVLLNFWATWCAPCVEEMPTLDALEADLRERGLSVLAVSEDRGGRDVVEPFLRDKLQLDELGIYLDPTGTLAQAFGLRGMPTTYLIDAQGRIVGGMEGPADWNGPAAKALVGYYLNQAERRGTLEAGS